MKSMTWILMAAFAAGALAQPHTKIAGVLSVTPVCGGGAEYVGPHPKRNQVWVALDPETFKSYLKTSGSGLVFHFYPVRGAVRGAEVKFTVTGPSANAKPGFSPAGKAGTYELVITDLKGANASEPYPFAIAECPLYP